MLKSFQLLCAFWLLLFGAAFAKSIPSHSLLHEGITLDYDANGSRISKRENGTLVQSYLYDFENRYTQVVDSEKGANATR